MSQVPRPIFPVQSIDCRVVKFSSISGVKHLKERLELANREAYAAQQAQAQQELEAVIGSIDLNDDVSESDDVDMDVGELSENSHEGEEVDNPDDLVGVFCCTYMFDNICTVKFPCMNDLKCPMFDIRFSFLIVFLGFAHFIKNFCEQKYKEGIKLYFHYIYNPNYVDMIEEKGCVTDFYTQVIGFRFTLDMNIVYNMFVLYPADNSGRSAESTDESNEEHDVDEGVDRKKVFFEYVNTQFCAFLNRPKEKKRKRSDDIEESLFENIVMDTYLDYCFGLVRISPDETAIKNDEHDEQFVFVDKRVVYKNQQRFIKNGSDICVENMFSRENNELYEQAYYARNGYPFGVFDGNEFWRNGMFSAPKTTAVLSSTFVTSNAFTYIYQLQLPFIQSRDVSRDESIIMYNLAAFNKAQMRSGKTRFTQYKDLRSYVDRDGYINMGHVLKTLEMLTRSVDKTTLSSAFAASREYCMKLFSNMSENITFVGSSEVQYSTDGVKTRVLSKSLGVFGNLVGGLLLNFELNGDVMTHYHSLMLLFCAFNAYWRKFDLHTNLMFCGKHGTGKSHICFSLFKQLIPGTTESITKMTDNFMATGEDDYDFIWYLDEMPSLFEDKKKTGEHGDAQLKQMMTNCTTNTRSMTQEKGERIPIHVQSEKVGVIIGVTNHDIDNMPQAMRDRFVPVYFAHKERNSVVLADRVLNGGLLQGAFIKQHPKIHHFAENMANDIRYLQYWQMRVEMCIHMKLLPDVESTFASAFLLELLKQAQKERLIGDVSSKSRFNLNFKKFSRTMTITTAIHTYFLHNQPRDDLECILGIWEYLIMTDKIVVATASLLWDSQVVELHTFKILEKMLSKIEFERDDVENRQGMINNQGEQSNEGGAQHVDSENLFLIPKEDKTKSDLINTALSVLGGDYDYSDEKIKNTVEHLCNTVYEKNGVKIIEVEQVTDSVEVRGRPQNRNKEKVKFNRDFIETFFKEEEVKLPNGQSLNIFKFEEEKLCFKKFLGRFFKETGLYDNKMTKYMFLKPSSSDKPHLADVYDIKRLIRQEGWQKKKLIVSLPELGLPDKNSVDKVEVSLFRDFENLYENFEPLLGKPEVAKQEKEQLATLLAQNNDSNYEDIEDLKDIIAEKQHAFLIKRFDRIYGPDVYNGITVEEIFPNYPYTHSVNRVQPLDHNGEPMDELEI